MNNKLIFIFTALITMGCGQKNQDDFSGKSDPLRGTPLVANLSANMVSNFATDDSIISAGSMNEARAAHTATLLKNGQVLVCGGFATSTLASAEIYDAQSKTFTSVGSMTVPRAGHTATILPDGKVLITGGYNGNYLSSTEIFDPETKTFTSASMMTTARSGHTATLLDNGKILYVGGVGVGWSFLKSAELYDIHTNLFSATGSMRVARESHTATLLKNGTVLVTGGHKGRRTAITMHSSAEIYNPSTEKFTLSGSMTIIRHKHDAVLLGDGSVLITGGSDERDSRGAYASAEIYDPGSAKFRSTASMNHTRYKHNGTSILLANGNALIACGADRAEIYNPKLNAFTVVKGSMKTDRLFSCATRLAKNEVLISGGYDENNNTSSNAWIYIPNSN